MIRVIAIVIVVIIAGLGGLPGARECAEQFTGTVSLSRHESQVGLGTIAVLTSQTGNPEAGGPCVILPRWDSWSGEERDLVLTSRVQVLFLTPRLLIPNNHQAQTNYRIR